MKMEALTLDEFNLLAAQTELNEATIDIAHAVLVDGYSTSNVVTTNIYRVKKIFTSVCNQLNEISASGKFDLLATKTELNEAAIGLARAVLVNRCPVTQVANDAGVSPRRVYHAVRAIRSAYLNPDKLPILDFRKLLSSDEFDLLATRFGLSGESLKITRDILVNGFTYAAVVKKYGVSKYRSMSMLEMFSSISYKSKKDIPMVSRLSPELFEKLAAETGLNENSRAMARAVFVDGAPQYRVAIKAGVAKQRVNLVVKTIRLAYSRHEDRVMED